MADGTFLSPNLTGGWLFSRASIIARTMRLASKCRRGNNNEAHVSIICQAVPLSQTQSRNHRTFVEVELGLMQLLGTFSVRRPSTRSSSSGCKRPSPTLASLPAN